MTFTQIQAIFNEQQSRLRRVENETYLLEHIDDLGARLGNQIDAELRTRGSSLEEQGGRAVLLERYPSLSNEEITPALTTLYRTTAAYFGLLTEERSLLPEEYALIKELRANSQLH